MLSRISMHTLLQYGSIGGLSCVVIGSLYQLQMTNKVKQAQFYRDAMDLLNEHQAADLYLGKPINSGYIDVFSSKNYADTNEAKLYVPLKGSKGKGEMFFSAVKQDDKWLITRVELEVKDNLGGKVLIHDDSNKVS